MSYLVALLIIVLGIWVIYMLSKFIPHLQYRRSFTILIAATLLLSFLKYALGCPQCSLTDFVPDSVWQFWLYNPILSQISRILGDIFQPIWQFFMLVIVGLGTPVFVLFFILVYLREFRRMNMQSRIALAIALLICIYAILNLWNLFLGFWSI
jgi:hypothetical protein